MEADKSAEAAARLLFDEMDAAGFIEFTTSDWDKLSASARERFKAIALAVIGMAVLEKAKNG